jgi:hypothetical protein
MPNSRVTKTRVSSTHAARRTLYACTLALLPAAAVAGTVYVPLPGVSTVGSAAYEPQVAIANVSVSPATVQQVSLLESTDGTVRTGVTPTPLTVPASRTSVVLPPVGFRGLLEVSGSPNVRYAARLAGKGAAGALGVALPVISDANRTKANAAVVLQGLQASATRTTWLFLVNLGGFDATCGVALVKSDGTPTTPASRSVAMEPLSLLRVADLFSTADAAAGVSEARVAVSCNREFYAFALLGDAASGELAVVEPSASGESALTVPGGEPPCPTGATCLSAKGVVLSPTPGQPEARVSFTPPVGAASRLRLSVDVTVGPWYPADPDGKHLVYWFVINKNRDMLGMLYFRGPTAYSALARHGVGLSHSQKPKIVTPFQGVPGRTYRVVNDYDMGRGVLTITVTDLLTGDVMATLTGTPNVSKVTFKATDRLLVDMGFEEGVTPDEVPSYGWTYSDVRVEVYP